ncbi:PilZ domain-containing protein [Candidatus Berkiella aquae]|uniref:PilZ domain-containing protein n=1 Tax=Candidatus Berkiella aquae TaxID=295108 RepID=A0A0Q9YWR3_9GAMM|nr:PilZ domain-containing protein [Candidatus Berkiella aquae]MCS5710349.1 PilZ domain-containing protein [Candidatus Berkiella aquae]
MKDERRRYFRIEDEVILTWRKITLQEKEQGLARIQRGEIDYPDTAGLFLSMEADLIDVIHSLAKQPEMAQAIDLLNRKINLFARCIPLNNSVSTLLDEEAQPVSLSASGISFETNEAVNKDQDIQLEMVLIPERIYILCFAVVVDCLPIESQTDENAQIYRMNVDFTTIRDEDIERLVQHIMRKEVAFLRARRKSRQND